MHPHAANPAAKPYLSLSIFKAPTASCEKRNEGSDKPSSSGAVAQINELWVGRTPVAEMRWDDTVPWVSSVPYPVLCSGSRFGANRRPAARRRSASLSAPLRGLGPSQNKFVSRGKEHHTNFFRAPPRKHSLALGSLAHSLTS